MAIELLKWRLRDTNYKHVRNDSGYMCPAGGLLRVTGKVADRPVLIGDAPGETTDTNFVVAAHDIANGAVGLIQRGAEVVLLMNEADEYAVGDRIGLSDTGELDEATGWPEGWAAVLNPNGPLEIIAVGLGSRGLMDGETPLETCGMVVARWTIGSGGSTPYLYKVTSTGEGVVYAKKVDDEGNVTGDAEEFIDGSALMGGSALEADAYCIVLLTADGQRVLCPLGGGGDPILVEVTAVDEEEGTVTAYALDSEGNTTGDPMTLLDMTAFEDD